MSDPVLAGDAVALAPELTSDEAVAMAPAAVPISALADESQVIPTASVLPDLATTTGAPQAVLGTKVADVLLMYDSMLYYDTATKDKHEVQLRRTMELYAQYFLGGAALESFYGYEGLVTQLQAYQTIRELVLYIHGEPGGFMVVYTSGGHLRPLSLVVEEDFKGVAPEVTNQVILEGCTVAEDPSRMVKLKDLFQTPRITGWNYFHAITLWSMTLTGSDSAATIQSALPSPDEYLLPGVPHPTTYAGQVGTFDFLYEWFRQDEDNTPTGPNPDRTVFVPRANATTIALFSEQAACMEKLKDPTQVKDSNGVQDLKALCDENDDKGLVDYLAQVTIRD